MRDLGLKLVSAADIAILAAVLLWLVLAGVWIAGLVAVAAAFFGGLLCAAWIIGVRNTPRSGIYK